MIRSSCLSFAVCVLCIGVIQAQVKEAGICPSHWKHHGSNCYLIVTGPMLNWRDAVNYCQTVSAEIIEIETAEENTYLKNSLLHNHTTVDIWVGATDKRQEGHWLWTNSQQPVKFTDWAPNEPYQGVGFECLTLTARQGFRWNDEDCNHKWGYICKKEALNEEIIIIG
eukprot:XP_011425305.1 PREDICTED: perlucin-like protein isoform X2 [Crassostrea gigas]